MSNINGTYFHLSLGLEKTIKLPKLQISQYGVFGYIIKTVLPLFKQFGANKRILETVFNFHNKFNSPTIQSMSWNRPLVCVACSQFDCQTLTDSRCSALPVTNMVRKKLLCEM